MAGEGSQGLFLVAWPEPGWIDGQADCPTTFGNDETVLSIIMIDAPTYKCLDEFEPTYFATADQGEAISTGVPFWGDIASVIARATVSRSLSVSGVNLPACSRRRDPRCDDSGGKAHVRPTRHAPLLFNLKRPVH